MFAEGEGKFMPEDSYLNNVREPLENLYLGFIDFLPNFLVAVIVLVVGWILAVSISKLIKSLLLSAKVDEFGNRLGLDQISARTSVQMSVAGTIAWLVKWFILVAIFLAAADILGLDQISNFLRDVLGYIPDVVAGAAILMAGLLLARFLSRLVRHSVQAAGLGSADLLAAVTQWAIVVFTVLATLQQLGVAPAFVQTLYTGFIAMLAIAGGLAFGMGGRDHASRALDKIERDIKS
jgi:hypothetical protein